MKFETRRLGLIDVEEAWAFQVALAKTVTPTRGHLLLLEHPPVFTLGRNADERHVIHPGGIPVHRTDRGGEVTYHGPGQLVGYLVADLRKVGIRRFVHFLEDSLVGLLGSMGVEASRCEGKVGVWASGGKIASIGLRVRRGISSHGFALNVCNDLEPFGRINPCGMRACPVTSVSQELGRPVGVDEAAERLEKSFFGECSKT